MGIIITKSRLLFGCSMLLSDGAVSQAAASLASESSGPSGLHGLKRSDAGCGLPTAPSLGSRHWPGNWPIRQLMAPGPPPSIESELLPQQSRAWGCHQGHQIQVIRRVEVVIHDCTRLNANRWVTRERARNCLIPVSPSLVSSIKPAFKFCIEYSLNTV